MAYSIVLAQSIVYVWYNLSKTIMVSKKNPKNDK